MYRARNNYLRLGTHHIFLNFGEDNLKDMEAINEAYGRGVRTKKHVHYNPDTRKHEVVSVGPVWSGNIHIFIDRVQIDDSPTTYSLLRQIKIKYGEIFKINVHYYVDMVADTVWSEHPDMPIIEWKDFEKVNFDDIDRAHGKLTFIKHVNCKKMYITGYAGNSMTPVEFVVGRTRIVVRRGGNGFEIASILMETSIKSNCAHYESYRLGPYYNGKR